MFYDKPVSESTFEQWERELARVSPRSDKLSWLKLVWVAGDPWQPVHRFMLYQMIGATDDPVTRRLRIPEPVWEQLNGPNPRTLASYFDVLKGEFVYPHGVSVPDIDRVQWQLFQDTGCYGRPYWVIQGEHGGHRRRFDHVESSLARMHGHPGEPPKPGELPYAPFDARVIGKIGPLDMVRLYKMHDRFDERPFDQLDAEEQTRKEHRQSVLWSWMETQVKDRIDKSDFKKMAYNAPRTDGPQPDYERMHEEFITQD